MEFPCNKKEKRVITAKNYLSHASDDDNDEEEERHVSQQSKRKRKRKSSIYHFIEDDIKVNDDNEDGYGGERPQAENKAIILQNQTQKRYDARKTKMKMPRKKKVKKIVTQNYLSILPEDVFLIVLQYSEKKEIENTRPFQTTWVNKCTLFVDMKKAFHAQNLHNMKWIKERNEGNLVKKNWEDFIEYGKPIANIGLVKWLMENALPMSAYVLESAAFHGDLEFMKYLYKKECPWGQDTFTRAALHGDLDNMKWLYEKECPFSDFTFFWAPCYGDLDNIRWLYEMKCPWGKTTIKKVRVCRSKTPIKENILQWMKKYGCP